MHIRSVLAIARKDALDIILNKTTLFALLTPILLALLFAFINGLIGTKTNEILVYNPSNSRLPEVVTNFFAHVKLVTAQTASEVDAAFGPDGTHKSSDYTAGLVIPANFDADLRSGQRPHLTVYINGDQVTGTDQQLMTQLLNDYASVVAHPEPAANLSVNTINPPKTTVIGDLTNSYIATALLSSFMVGASLIPSLLVEEKEKKTIRMLMVSPASFTDIVMGKLLVVEAYQLVLSLIVTLILKGFLGNIALEIVFILVGSCFALSLGLVAGSVFQSSGGVGGFVGIMSLVFFLPALFVGPLGTLIANNPIGSIIKVIPTYYIADGIVRALQNQGPNEGVLFDLALTIACTSVFFVASAWLLRRQAAVVATI